VREDYVQHAPVAAQGRAGLRQFVLELRRAFPDLVLEVKDLVAEGDRVVARVEGRGTHEGEFLGVPATGRATVGRSIDIFRIEGGQLAEHWDVLDVYGLLAQLGAVPPLGPPPT
jgi:steroid delta-isomerase-like uncharacterized protein